MQLSARKNTLALVLQCVQYQEEISYSSYCNSLCAYFWYTKSHVAFFRHSILMKYHLQMTLCIFLHLQRSYNMHDAESESLMLIDKNISA